jgi:fructose-bisphosphate aldolase class II
MTLVNTYAWLLHAQRNRFALGAFNANTLEQAQAIVAGAEQERAPVIIQVSRRALEYAGAGNPILGLRYMARIGAMVAESAAVPVALHLDHGTEEQLLQAMALGFTSVMFDGGALPFQENVRITKKLRDKVHLLGISIEAELGKVPRADLANGSAVSDVTDPDQAAEFVNATDVDALAIAIGSVHAVKEKNIRLDLERLKAVRARVDVPLVLHGSSGVTDDCIKDAMSRER